jgi:hypothetical protein
MSKHISELLRDPFSVSLADRAISMFIDPGTGAIFIDEGAGNDRMNGAAIPAAKGPHFSCTLTDSGCVLKVQSGTFAWEVGWVEDAIDAANWVEAVNRFLATKKDPATPNGRVVPQAPVESAIANRPAKEAL